MKVDADISLDPAHVDNAEELFHLVDQNRDYLQQYLPWVLVTKSVSDSREFLKDTKHVYMIREKGILAGLVGYTLDIVNHSAEIGYWLGEAFQGRGVMRRSVAALAESIEAHRIEIRCAVTNMRSQRIPEALGFEKEARLKDSLFFHDHYEDAFIYSLIK